MEFTNLDSLCSDSDFITIHVPKTESTVDLFNLERFKTMKPTSKIINCSRGGIINEEDLLTALNENIIGGAALDVFEQEPATNSNILKAKNILFTPHLGASTLEAKEGVSKAICSQVRDYLLDGKIGNALNIPVSDMNLINNLEPFLNLAEKLGSLHQQIASGPIDTVSITTAGSLKETNLVALAFLKGFLQEIHGSTVNYINATAVAESTGIQIEETYNHSKINYSNLISSEVDINGDLFSIRGSLFGDSLPRIVYLDGFHMDLVPEGKALLVYNKDIPGVIGKVGTLLGNVKVNIAGYQLGRKEDSDIAIGVVRLDSEPSSDVIERIADLDEVISATIVSFD